MAIKFTYIYHCKTLPKFSQIGIFGLKIYHLAIVHLAVKNTALHTSHQYIQHFNPIWRAIRNFGYFVSLKASSRLSTNIVFRFKSDVRLGYFLRFCNEKIDRCLRKKVRYGLRRNGKVFKDVSFSLLQP
jgi:hypothetical protein